MLYLGIAKQSEGRVGQFLFIQTNIVYLEFKYNQIRLWKIRFKARKYCLLNLISFCQSDFAGSILTCNFFDNFYGLRYYKPILIPMLPHLIKFDNLFRVYRISNLIVYKYFRTLFGVKGNKVRASATVCWRWYIFFFGEIENFEFIKWTNEVIPWS